MAVFFSKIFVNIGQLTYLSFVFAYFSLYIHAITLDSSIINIEKIQYNKWWEVTETDFMKQKLLV